MSNKIKDLEEIAEIITIAIARERSSARYYREATRKALTGSAMKMFSILEMQEMGHEEKLRAQLQEIEDEIKLEKLKENQI